MDLPRNQFSVVTPVLRRHFSEVPVAGRVARRQANAEDNDLAVEVPALGQCIYTVWGCHGRRQGEVNCSAHPMRLI